MKKAAFLFFRVEVRNAACAVQYLVVVQTMLVRCPKNLDFTMFQKVSLSNLIFDEASKTVEIQTHNTALKKRLTQYAAEYPNLCRQTDDDEQGGLTFEIDRRRFAVRLTAPYSDERRHAASELAKGNTNRLRNAK